MGEVGSEPAGDTFLRLFYAVHSQHNAACNERQNDDRDFVYRTHSRDAKFQKHP